MLELTDDLAATFVDLIEASGANSGLIADFRDVFQALLDLPKPTAPQTGDTAQWFAPMATETAADDTGHHGNGSHTSHADAGIVEALGILTAFARGDLDV